MFKGFIGKVGNGKFRFVVGVVLALVLLSSTVFASSGISKTIKAVFNSVSVNIDGKVLSGDKISYGGNIYVSSKAVASLLGKDCIVDKNGNVSIIKKVVAVSTTTPVPSTSLSISNKSTVNEIQNYLTKKYPQLITDIGIMKFNYVVDENESTLKPYDYWIQTRYDDDMNFTMDNFNSIKYTDNQKNSAKLKLKDFQVNLAKDITKSLVNKKIKGELYDSWYKYPSLQLELQEVNELTWVNYTDSTNLMMFYKDTKINKLVWYMNDDNYFFRDIQKDSDFD